MKDTIIKYGMTITNAQKIMFSKNKITKMDVITYYKKIANKMLPYISNRLLSFKVCPKGSSNSCFIMKHLNYDLKGVKSKKVKNEDGSSSLYYYIDSLQGLLSLVQFNVIEFHMQTVKVDDILHPDIMVFDLDPDIHYPLQSLINAVKLLYKKIKKYHFTAKLKTSGNKGYHIIVYLGNKLTHNEVKKLSLGIVLELEQEYPNIFTSSILKKNRKGKIFIDYLRNSKGATVCAPYSLRANKDATISKPISFSKIKESEPNKFTILDYINKKKREN